MSEQSAHTVRSLPLVTLHLTDRCNSRCISCDYWRHGERDISLETISALLPELHALGTRTIMITGGEPLIHPQWFDIATLLRANDIHLWLHTSGVSLAKHAARAASLFESITVSLDGSDAHMYAAIRGVHAFDHVCDGIRAVVERATRVSIRTTVQRLNYSALPRIVDLAHTLGVVQVSFLAADVTNRHAFGRGDEFISNIALERDDLPRFEATLDALNCTHARDFDTGFIAESPGKLRRLLNYYTALAGLADFPPVRCNAPEFSAVLNTDGRVNPCFFIEGPPQSHIAGYADGQLAAALNTEEMRTLRLQIRERRRPECARCVCSLWRNLDDVRDLALRPAEAAA